MAKLSTDDITVIWTTLENQKEERMNEWKGGGKKRKRMRERGKESGEGRGKGRWEGRKKGREEERKETTKYLLVVTKLVS